jgi:hypothetical protein
MPAALLILVPSADSEDSLPAALSLRVLACGAFSLSLVLISAVLRRPRGIIGLRRSRCASLPAASLALLEESRAPYGALGNSLPAAPSRFARKDTESRSARPILGRPTTASEDARFARPCLRRLLAALGELILALARRETDSRFARADSRSRS